MGSNLLTGSIPEEVGARCCIRDTLFDKHMFEFTQQNLFLSTPFLLDAYLISSFPCSPANSLWQIGMLTNLVVLGGTHCHFTDALPESIGNLQRLVQLHISDNKLTGTMPTSLSALTLLDELDLSSNKITGSIPSLLGNCTRMRVLRVGLCSHALLSLLPFLPVTLVTFLTTKHFHF